MVRDSLTVGPGGRPDLWPEARPVGRESASLGLGMETWLTFRHIS